MHASCAARTCLTSSFRSCGCHDVKDEYMPLTVRPICAHEACKASARAQAGAQTSAGARVPLLTLFVAHHVRRSRRPRPQGLAQAFPAVLYRHPHVNVLKPMCTCIMRAAGASSRESNPLLWKIESCVPDTDADICNICSKHAHYSCCT
jgi:hypothetical protein